MMKCNEKHLCAHQMNGSARAHAHAHSIHILTTVTFITSR